ncbi:hypothetical protein vseg_007212 [Gypsophila vaccaria]
MPKNIQKTLQKYISKIKKQAPNLQISHSTLASTTSRMLSTCKHPKSLSYDFESNNLGHQRDEAATLEDIDRFLIENFKSLYGQNDEDTDNDNDNDNNKFASEDEKEKDKCTPNESGQLSGAIYDSRRFFTPPLDLCGSSRFFTSQTSSGSLLEETRLSGVGTSTSTSGDVESLLSASIVNAMAQGHSQEKGDKSGIPEGIEDCVAVLTVSPNPYEEFVRSMQAMLDARIRHNQRVDWDFMEELLFCYLRLNEKKQYKFILSAFVDLVVFLRQNSNGGTEGSQSSDVESNDSKGKIRGD